MPRDLPVEIPVTVTEGVSTFYIMLYVTCGSAYIADDPSFVACLIEVLVDLAFEMFTRQVPLWARPFTSPCISVPHGLTKTSVQDCRTRLPSLGCVCLRHAQRGKIVRGRHRFCGSYNKQRAGSPSLIKQPQANVILCSNLPTEWE